MEPRQAPKNHTLIVGGTGMLADASIELAKESITTSVVASTVRSLRRLRDRAESIPAELNPICVDYRRTDELSDAIRKAIAKFGKIDLVIAWIHSTSPEAPLAIARLVADHEKPVDMFIIRGSSSNVETSRQVESILEEMPGIQFHKIALGVHNSTGKIRWLTDREISSGVLEAVRTNTKMFLVGTVTSES